MEAGSRPPVLEAEKATPSASPPPAGPRLALLALAREAHRLPCSIRNGREITSVFTRAEIGPARSTSNGRPTALPARSSRSVPTSSE